MLTEQDQHETSTNHGSHALPWKISIKKKIFLFNPGDMTRSQCKVEGVPILLARVGAKVFY